jgi:hypothetical protein
MMVSAAAASGARGMSGGGRGGGHMLRALLMGLRILLNDVEADADARGAAAPEDDDSGAVCGSVFARALAAQLPSARTASATHWIFSKCSCLNADTMDNKRV